MSGGGEGVFPGVPAAWRVLVCGGRGYADVVRVSRYLDWLHEGRRVVLLIEGGAQGADTLARNWALDRGVPIQSFPANWNAEGRAAGPKRNQRMIDEGRPSFVVAFPGGKGTEDMTRRAKSSGLRVFTP